MSRIRRLRGPVLAVIATLAVIGAGVVVAGTTAHAATTWRQVDVGDSHICGIRTDGSLWCWGSNWGGQLGVGDTEDRSRPTRVGTRKDWHKVSAGNNRTCALTTGTEIYCWGFEPNDDRTLPPRRRGTIETEPKRVNGLGWTDVSVMADHACGISGGTLAAPKGRIYCWGLNDYGQLGTGNTTKSRDPKVVSSHRDWIQISVDFHSTCAIRQAGPTLYCWGDNAKGRLGLGDDENRRKPAEVDDGFRYVESSGPICAVTTTGSLYCWGSNSWGQVGRGYTSVVEPEPTYVSKGPWATVAVGVTNVCAIRTDGRGYCWGRDTALGRSSDPGDPTRPAPLYGDHRWQSISVGFNRACGIRTDGRLYCWDSGTDTPTPV